MKFFLAFLSLAVLWFAAAPHDGVSAEEEPEESPGYGIHEGVPYGGVPLADAEAIELIKNEKNLLILDVRTEREYKLGHLKGSKLIPVEELENRLAELEGYKDKKILAVCEMGMRGEQAGMILEEKGFNDIYFAADGLMGIKDALGLER